MASKDDDYMERVVDAWIAHANCPSDTPEEEEGWWAVREVYNFRFRGHPDLLWDFVLRAYQRPMSETAFFQLAAGPLEGLLSDYGEQYIDRIEEIARNDLRFRELLYGIWKAQISNEVWERLDALAREFL